MRICQEAFEIEGPDGSHLCLVYEPMREPLWIFQRRFVEQKFPLSIAKAFLYNLLAGLDYLHLGVELFILVRRVFLQLGCSYIY